MFRRPPGQIRWEPCAKPGGGARWIVRLGGRDDRTYRRLVAPLVPAIERSLGSIAFANRAGPGARLGPWRPARRAWGRVVRAAAGGETEVIVVSDVRDCYGSMGERALRVLGIGGELDRFLRTLRDAGIRGLPIGPEPSAILANAILGIADREAEVAGCRPIRWVDDVAFAAAGRGTARRAFDAWRRTLEELGLEAHEGKTGWHDRSLLTGLPRSLSASGSAVTPRGIIRTP